MAGAGAPEGAALTRRAGWVLVAGAALGAAYTASPLTILFALVLAAVCWISTRGLPDHARRWVTSALAVAIVARVLAVVFLLVATDPFREPFRTLFPDAHFSIERSWWIRNLWLGVPIGPYYTDFTFRPYGESSFSYALAVVQTVFGIAPYGVTFLSIACFIAGAMLLFHVAQRSYGRVAAMAGLLLLLAWPTFFAWSVSVLRESTQFLLFALTVAGTIAAVRARGWTGRVAPIAIAAAAMYALESVRAGVTTIVVLGFAFGIAIRLATLRWWSPALALLLIVIVAPRVAGRVDVRDRVASEVQLAASRHMGHTEMPGGTYKLLDDRFYNEGKEAPFSMSYDEGVRFLLRGAAASVLFPLPWQLRSTSSLVSLPQQCLWYVAIACAVLGFAASLRRDALLTLMLGGYILAGLIVIAPNNGNFGTLVRHRDMVVPALVWLAGAGFCAMVAKAVPDPEVGVPS